MTKVKVLLVFLAVITMTTVGASCVGKGQVDNNSNKADASTASNDSIGVGDDDGLDDDVILMEKSLNNIRFGNFKDDDWGDNEYIRSLRKTLDALNAGKGEAGEFVDGNMRTFTIDGESMLIPEWDSVKENIKGKFVACSVEPFIGGGLQVYFVFVDRPEILFAAWVYSYVDGDTGEITGYPVRNLEQLEGESGITKESLSQLLRDHPETKLW